MALNALTIMTVSGPIRGDQMGVSLSHEHVMLDPIGPPETGPHRWDVEEIAQAVLPNIVESRKLGFQTFVDCTPDYIGRDARVLRRLHELTGMQFLTNTGYYAANFAKHMPDHGYTETARQLADRWVTEFNEGIAGTDIRPGFIKIGVNGLRPRHKNQKHLAVNDPPTQQDPTERFYLLNDLDRKIVAAAALTHLDTGMTVASHTGNADPFGQVEILADHGVAPDAFIWVHAQRLPARDTAELAHQGAWISFDGIRKNNTDEYCERLAVMKDRGVLHRVLLSHDSGWYTVGEPGGGERIRGYRRLKTDLEPTVLGRNVLSEAEWHQVIAENPARAFALRVRSL